MRWWITRTWMVWLGLVAAGCGHDPKMDAPWLPLDLSQRSQPKSTAPKTSYTDNSGRVGGTVSGEDAWEAANPRPWKYIVIHHAAEESGNAATFDTAHRARGWDGLGYHFVIDNGKGGPDGRVEVGPRWKQQKWGAHTGNTPDNAYNNYGIGVCLVGNYMTHMPSPEQIASLGKLVRYLAAKYGIPPENVIGHRDAPGAKTECPGDVLHAWIHKTLRPSLHQVARK